MSNKLRLILSFVFVALIVLAVGFFRNYGQSSVKNPAGLKVVFFNVGQGDSALIETQNNTQMLIDGGPSGEIIIEKLSKEMPYFDRKIEFIVLSHPHADHLTGLIEVLKRYDVGQIIATDAVHTSPQFMEWLNLIKEKQIPLELSTDVSEIDLGEGVKVKILYPKISFKDKEIDNLNNTSIVLRLEYVGVSFLFTGDLEKDAQQKLIENLKLPRRKVGIPIETSGKIENSQFLKIPHHGSKNALDDKLLEAVAPKVAVISVGKNNYGHPSSETLFKLKKHQVEIKRTDKDGDVKVMVGTDGKFVVSH